MNFNRHIFKYSHFEICLNRVRLNSSINSSNDSRVLFIRRRNVMDSKQFLFPRSWIILALILAYLDLLFSLYSVFLQIFLRKNRIQVAIDFVYVTFHWNLSLNSTKRIILLRMINIPFDEIWQLNYLEEKNETKPKCDALKGQ